MPVSGSQDAGLMKQVCQAFGSDSFSVSFRSVQTESDFTSILRGSLRVMCQRVSAGYGVVFVHTEPMDFRVVSRILSWWMTNVVWGLWTSPSSVHPDNFALTNRVSRLVLLVASRSGPPQLDKWPLTIGSHYGFGDPQRAAVSTIDLLWSTRSGFAALSVSTWGLRLLGRRHTRSTCVSRRRKGNEMFAKLIADSLCQSVMLIALAR